MQHISYKDVVKANVNNPLDVYRQIAAIAGGDPNAAHDGGMDLTGLPESKIKRIEKLLGINQEETEPPAAVKTIKKEGK